MRGPSGGEILDLHVVAMHGGSSALRLGAVLGASWGGFGGIPGSRAEIGEDRGGSGRIGEDRGGSKRIGERSSRGRGGPGEGLG